MWKNARRSGLVTAATVIVSAGLGIAIGSLVSTGRGSWIVLGGLVLGIGLWTLRPPSAGVSAVCLTLLVLMAAVAGVVTAADPLAKGLLGVAAALLVAVPAALAASVRQWVQHRRLGWELAHALAGQETARVREAVTRERSAMAGEIHDRLGHQLTLIAMQLGRLSLDDTLKQPEIHREIEMIRSRAADAAEELGETVQLLKTAGEPTPIAVERCLQDVLDGVRWSGVSVDGHVPPELDSALGPYAHAALERVLSEAMTNAAKHSPGERITVSATLDHGQAVLMVDNPCDPRRPDQPAGSRYGLESLRHRLKLLGGTLEVDAPGSHFRLRATVSATARPSQASDRAEEVTRQEETARAAARTRLRLAWVLPTGLAATAAMLAILAFAYVNVFSVLPVDRFAQITAGMPQSQAEAMLPPVQMPDAPRTTLANPPGADCRFYEASVSFFERDQVFRICFAGGAVTSTDVIPPGH